MNLMEWDVGIPGKPNVSIMYEPDASLSRQILRIILFNKDHLQT